MDTWDAAKDSAAWLIRKYALKLRRHPGLRHRHPDDLADELWGELGVAWCSFTPDRGQPSAYVSSVVHNAAVTLARRAAVRYRSFGEALPFDDRASAADTDGSARLDLRQDIALVMASLPPELRRVAELLCDYGPSEVGRILGRTRSWVYRARDDIASYFRAAGIDSYLEMDNGRTGGAVRTSPNRS